MCLDFLMAWSVVAVHGIGADPDWTWTASETDEEAKVRAKKMKVAVEEIEKIRTNWLEAPNMLPKVIPKARIMRFGYESHWFGDTAVKQSVSSVADILLQRLVQKRKVSLCPAIFRKASPELMGIGLRTPANCFHRSLLWWSCHPKGRLQKIVEWSRGWPWTGF